MRRWRPILSTLVMMAYLAVIGGTTFQFAQPAGGTGVPAIDQSKGGSRDAPRPQWVQRRHLPLLKPVSFDHALALVSEIASLSDQPRTLVSGTRSDCPSEQFGSPSPGRAPPLHSLA